MERTAPPEPAPEKPGLLTRIRNIGGGSSIVPLLLLFGFNAMDELDREAFQVLLPNIQEHFDLSLTGVTALVAAVIPAGLLLGVPIARYADRHTRVPVAIVGATVWGLFSFGTGVATTVLLLGATRLGSGLGKAVNDPVHGSLLSDYYPPTARARVFAVHRGANTVGAFCGALGAGFIGRAFGWRVPFIAFAVPTLLLVLAAVLLLREPERTGRRLADGEAHPTFREAFRVLWGIRTMRRIWLAFPFFAFVAIGMGAIMSLFYENIFGVDEAGRGIIRAFDAPFIVLGLVVGSPFVDRGITEDAGVMMRRIAFGITAIAVCIAGIALSPWLGMAIAFNYAVSTMALLLFAAGTAVISLVAPPEGRAFAFAFFNIAALLGVVALPIVGAVGDALSLRWGVGVLVPVLFVGATIFAASGRTAREDIARVNAPDDDPEEDPDEEET